MSGLAATGGAEHAERAPLRAHVPDMAVGVIGAVVTIAATLLAPNAEYARIMLGTLLGGIGCIYVGFAVADGRPSAIVIQAISALVFLSVANLGIYHQSDVLLGLGFIGHGTWDALHHEHRGWARVRTYWPPFCAVVDFLTAAAILSGIAT